MYYRAFAVVYGALGGASSIVLVNSNWTRAHVEEIWWGCAPQKGGAHKGGMAPSAVTVVFPPCDVGVFAALPLQRGKALVVQGDVEVVLCSVAQFRPEKNHACAPGHYFAVHCDELSAAAASM